MVILIQFTLKFIGIALSIKNIIDYYECFFKKYIKTFKRTFDNTNCFFFVLPIISRLYDPNQFGVFNLVMSVAAFFSVFCGLGYHQAIVLPKKDNDALDLLKISFLITFC